MADKAEKDLDQASDCGWVRGLDANGNPIKIAKADLVKLIRANMPVATMEQNGLMGKDGFFSSSSHCIDANSATVSGTYFVSNTSVNAGRNSWGTLIVFKSYYTVQLNIAATSVPEFYIRMFVGDNWTAWKSISFT